MTNYDNIAEHYFERRKDTSRFDYNRDIDVPNLVEFIGNVNGKTILDIGCGFGDHALHLSKSNFKHLFGFDVSKKFVDLANKQHIPNTTFYIADMKNKIEHDDSTFDIVFSSLAIHYVEDINAVFSEIFRVLKPDGIFCFSTGHPIYNLLNQTDEHIIGCKKNTDGTKTIFGNYFDESAKPNDLGSLGKVYLHNFTFETFIKTGLNNGFELIDYKDMKPTEESKQYDAEKYKLLTTLPSFMMFKFKKPNTA